MRGELGVHPSSSCSIRSLSHDGQPETIDPSAGWPVLTNLIPADVSTHRESTLPATVENYKETEGAPSLISEVRVLGFPFLSNEFQKNKKPGRLRPSFTSKIGCGGWIGATAS